MVVDDGRVTGTAARRTAAVRRALRTIAVALTLTAGASGFVAASAAAADFTWSGAAAPAQPTWLNTANWLGGVAPSGPVGTLSFPLLTSPGCTATPPTAACYSSVNDISGLSINALTIDDGAPYTISGNAITLGAGGLTAGTTSPTSAFTSLNLPLTLTASQTWALDGNGVNAQVGIHGNVTGAAAALAITLSHQTFLSLSGNDVEVGPISISGGALGSGPMNGSVGVASSTLNSINGNPIGLTNAGLVGFNGTVGPLTVTGGHLQIGAPTGKLTVNGPLTLDAATTVAQFVNGPGTIPGTDYSQLSATGPVDLANAHLNLLQSAPCSALSPGAVDTLITTSATLTGTFAGLPDGATAQIFCGVATPQTARINYTAHAVTATVLGNAPPPPPDTTAPVITISTPAAGQHFAQGQSVASSFQCSDGTGSGVSTCAGPATVDTSAPGTRTFTVTASDVAGNGSSKSVDYIVDAPAAGLGAPATAPAAATPAAATPDATAPAVIIPPVPAVTSTGGAAASFSTSPRTLRVSRTGSFRFPFAWTPLGTGKIGLKSTKKLKIGSKTQFLKLAPKAFTASASGRVNVTLKLSSKQLKALKHVKKLGFTVAVTSGGKTFTTKLTLKAPG